MVTSFNLLLLISDKKEERIESVSYMNKNNNGNTVRISRCSSPRSLNNTSINCGKYSNMSTPGLLSNTYHYIIYMDLTDTQERANRRKCGLLRRIYCFKIGMNVEIFTSLLSEIISFSNRSRRLPP